MRQETWRAREVRRVVARWERSGLSEAAIARQCGMLVHTVTWWRPPAADGGVATLHAVGHRLTIIRSFLRHSWGAVAVARLD